MDMLEEFKKSKLVINVRSQKEYDDLMEFLEEKGFEYNCVPISRPTRFNNYGIYKEETCITCFGKNIAYCSCQWFFENMVVTFEQFMSNVKGSNKKGVFFKTLPNNFTGNINVKKGYIDKKEILDKEEKQYLEAVLRPFKNEVEYVMKFETLGENEAIVFYLMYEDFNLPIFKKNTMYRNMQVNKKYTLKELGLFENE